MCIRVPGSLGVPGGLCASLWVEVLVSPACVRVCECGARACLTVWVSVCAHLGGSEVPSEYAWIFI